MSELIQKKINVNFKMWTTVCKSLSAQANKTRPRDALSAGDALSSDDTNADVLPFVTAMGQYSNPTHNAHKAEDDEGAFIPESVYKTKNQPHPILAGVVHSGISYQQAIISPRSYTKPWTLDEFQLVPGKPEIKNQKQTGYCWVYATACVLEQYLNTEHKREKPYEISIAYWQYFDVLEKTNHFLEAIIQTAQSHDIESRLMYTLLDSYPNDGGQYTFAQNLIAKYGFMLNENYSRSPAAEVTSSLNRRLNRLVKSSVMQIRKRAVANIDAARELKSRIMDEVIQVLHCHLLPPPPQTNEELKLSANAKQYANHYVSVLHDSRINTENTHILQVDCLGNVIGAPPATFVRCPDVEDMVDLAALQLCGSKRPIWIGSTWSTDISTKCDSLNVDNSANDPIINFPMDKISRIFDVGLDLGEHATCIVGSKLGADGKISHFLIQNSHGNKDKLPGKGHLCMCIEWFKQYINIIVIDKAILRTYKGGKLLPKTPSVSVMAGWSRLGTLAECQCSND